VTVQRARDRASNKDDKTRRLANLAPERTCFRCDSVFRVASDDRRVYCPACRTAYGFRAPVLADFTPGAQLALFREARNG
jgi:hypothetical protein